MRNSKHMNGTPITSEQYFMDHLSKDRTTDTLENIIKHFEDKHLRVTDANHDTQRGNRKACPQ